MIKITIHTRITFACVLGGTAPLVLCAACYKDPDRGFHHQFIFGRAHSDVRRIHVSFKKQESKLFITISTFGL